MSDLTDRALDTASAKGAAYAEGDPIATLKLFEDLNPILDKEGYPRGLPAGS